MAAQSAYDSWRAEEERAIERSNRGRWGVFAFFAGFAFFPPLVLLYVVGSMVTWVRRGFRKNE